MAESELAFFENLGKIIKARTNYGKAVKRIADELLEKREYEDLEGKVLLDYMKKLSSKLVEYYAKEKTPRMPEAVKDFLEFIKKEIAVQAKARRTTVPDDEDFIPCKNPMEESGIRFDDIAGQEEVKKDIEVNYIFPFRLPLLFTAKSQGILMYGPPGVGKTLLAKAATAEIPDVAFYTPTPGEMRGKYEGETERFIARIFECAREAIEDPTSKYKFAVIFIDEFEGVAGQRADDPTMTRSVNALLQAMDGITSSPNVSVIAATNFPDTLDSAIRRRFTAEIFIDLPSLDAREFLVRQVLAKNYSSPRIPMEIRATKLFDKRSRDAEGRITEWRNDYLNNINDFGGDFCQGIRSTEGGPVPEWLIITPEFIKEVVKLTGPSDLGLGIIDTIIVGEDVDGDRYKDQGSIFGYSASDVVKMMNIAVQIASFRAMENVFTKTRLKGDDTIYFRSVPFLDVDPEDVVYVAMESVFEKYGGDLENLDATPNLRLMTPEQKFYAINFGICQGDIMEAIIKYPSTIKNNEYINLLKYKYRT